MFTDKIWGWLEKCLDLGITEEQFWNMTLGELERQLKSLQRVQESRRKEKAIFDYTQAELIGRSVARIYSKDASFPDISEIYPSLFSSKEIEEQRQAKRNELSVLRFKQFTDDFNNRIKEGKDKADE